MWASLCGDNEEVSTRGRIVWTDAKEDEAMEIRKNPDLPSKPILPKPPEGDETARGIMAGGCILPGSLPPIKPDRDRLEFRRRDEDKNGVLTSDEYGVGKQKQDEFRRYDRNDDGQVTRKEFKLGRFLDRLRKGEIEFKPVPMPMPKFPEGGIKPVPMPMPDFPDLKPIPMPKIHLAGEPSVGDLVAKVKQAQAQDEK
jgi:hypothetical protein